MNEMTVTVTDKRGGGGGGGGGLTESMSVRMNSMSYQSGFSLSLSLSLSLSPSPSPPSLSLSPQQSYSDVISHNKRRRRRSPLFLALTAVTTQCGLGESCNEKKWPGKGLTIRVSACMLVMGRGGGKVARGRVGAKGAVGGGGGGGGRVMVFGPARLVNSHSEAIAEDIAQWHLIISVHLSQAVFLTPRTKELHHGCPLRHCCDVSRENGWKFTKPVSSRAHYPHIPCGNVATRSEFICCQRQTHLK